MEDSFQPTGSTEDLDQSTKVVDKANDRPNAVAENSENLSDDITFRYAGRGVVPSNGLESQISLITQMAISQQHGTMRIENSLETVKNNIGSANTKISLLESGLDTLKTDVYALKGDVASLNSGFAVTQVEIEALKKQFTTLNASNASLQKDMATVKSDVQELKENGKELKKGLEYLKKGLEDLKKGLEDLTKVVEVSANSIQWIKKIGTWLTGIIGLVTAGLIVWLITTGGRGQG